jgi:transcription factor C subunit 7
VSLASPDPGSTLQGERLKIRGEPGLGEWYGAAPFEHPTSAAPAVLQTLFPALDDGYEPVTRPTRTGESLAELHDRVASTMHGIISQCDTEGVRAILICTHAAVVIALGRVLTGDMPESVDAEDFRAFTCGVSVYVRKGPKGVDDAAALPMAAGGGSNPTARIGGDPQATSAKGIAAGPPAKPWGHGQASRTDPKSLDPSLAWKGRGVADGWVCTANSDCSHLSGGEERGW